MLDRRCSARAARRLLPLLIAAALLMLVAGLVALRLWLGGR